MNVLKRNLVLSILGIMIVSVALALHMWFFQGDDVYRFQGDDDDEIVEIIPVSAPKFSNVTSSLVHSCAEGRFIDVRVTHPMRLSVDDSAQFDVFVDAGESRCDTDESPFIQTIERDTLPDSISFSLTSPVFSIAGSCERPFPAGSKFPLEFSWDIAPDQNRDGSLRLDFSGLIKSLGPIHKVIGGLTINGESSELDQSNTQVHIDVYEYIPIKASTIQIITVVLIAIGLVVNSPLLIHLLKSRTSTQPADKTSAIATASQH